MNKELEHVYDNINLFRDFFLKLDLEEIIREDSLGSQFALTEVRFPLEQVKTLLLKFELIDLYDLPEDNLVKIQECLTTLKGQTDNAKAFNPTLANAAKRRIDLVQNIKKYYSALFQELSLVFSLKALRKEENPNYKKANTEIKSILKNIKATEEEGKRN